MQLKAFSQRSPHVSHAAATKAPSTPSTAVHTQPGQPTRRKPLLHLPASPRSTWGQQRAAPARGGLLPPLDRITSSSGAGGSTTPYEGNASSLVATLRDWRRLTGSSGGAGYSGDVDNTAGAVAGGVVAALTLAYQEAKQGPWMARGFVGRFLECGGAEEVLPLMHDPHSHVAGAAFELVQALVGQHLVAREALLAAGVVAQLLRLLGGPQAARRAKFDAVMLLSDLLESALAADAALASKAAKSQRDSDPPAAAAAAAASSSSRASSASSESREGPSTGASSAALVAGRMAEHGGLELVVRRLRSSDPAARAMAARLVGLVASCGDGLRAELLAAEALPALVAALEATEALTAAVATPGGGGAGQGATGLVPPFTVHHDQNMQYQIASGLLQLCAVSSPQPGPAGAAVDGRDAADRKESSMQDSGEDQALVDELVDTGAVPPLLRLRSLSYPRPLREGSRRVLRPLLRLRGDAVRAAAAEVSIPQPRGTPPADWLAWRLEFENDLSETLP